MARAFFVHCTKNGLERPPARCDTCICGGAAVPPGGEYVVENVEASIISLLERFVEEWGVDHKIGPGSAIVADLEFESIDIIQLVVAIEQKFGRRNMGFDELLMKNGRYVDDLTVRQISNFVGAKLQLVPA